MLFRSIEILWNLLEYGDRLKVAEQLNSHVAISQLRDSFLQQLLQGYSNYDRQLRLKLCLLDSDVYKFKTNSYLKTNRNDILIISNQLASVLPRLPFIETGFAKELLLFATYPESMSACFF